jgi:hypothetical protein
MMAFHANGQVLESHPREEAKNPRRRLAHAHHDESKGH